MSYFKHTLILPSDSYCRKLAKECDSGLSKYGMLRMNYNIDGGHNILINSVSYERTLKKKRLIVILFLRINLTDSDIHFFSVNKNSEKNFNKK